eukprot:CAMPEP_0119550074 /NCGR_PEP_ID=MMETSP1352-20130426/3682_1 /TAXON_ID=265584 /ORGANISM="Stauroneis constricta, Strain CCMP1120" /LENGTH=30 /DNA_ID= /DNA_START= /DNA_END= /DNA_ORIENTATION=
MDEDQLVVRNAVDPGVGLCSQQSVLLIVNA